MVPGYEADDVIGFGRPAFRLSGHGCSWSRPTRITASLWLRIYGSTVPASQVPINELLARPRSAPNGRYPLPLQVIDILTLCGDSSDNAGSAGCRSVGAAKLLSQYSSVEGHMTRLSASYRAPAAAVQGRRGPYSPLARAGHDKDGHGLSTSAPTTCASRRYAPASWRL